MHAALLLRRSSRVSTASRLMVVGALVALVAGLAPAAAHADEHDELPVRSAGGCQLTGTASFGPGLNWLPNSHTYAFNGNLSLCNSGPEAGPTGGTVRLGGITSEPSPNDPELAWRWQEPVGSAVGGCANLYTQGLSIVRWNTGAVTVMHTQTTSVTGFPILLTAKVVDSVTLRAVEPKEDPEQPDTLVLSTNLFKGGDVAGALSATGPTLGYATCALSSTASISLQGATVLVERA